MTLLTKNGQQVWPGADESSPSRAQYFSWINNTNEGPSEEQTLVNLAFFAWLKREYGMQLDIYAFDAGCIDGKNRYGTMTSPLFRRAFPAGFDRVVERAAEIGTRLGIWGGPDGFGDTEESAQERIAMMVSLCEKHHFALFKFDAVCGHLPATKEKYFIAMMEQCRRFSPDLILLNHRLRLSEEALAHATTFLWEGRESYVDTFSGSSNPRSAPHHRLGMMQRGIPQQLRRLTEDHGVCLSSCMDNWDDDLILQAFNRCMILAPEIYGNPWLLRDAEYSRLAFIFNLHRQYREILVEGKILPEEECGPVAVSRGNRETRFITLRNLSWQTVSYRIRSDDMIGLELPAGAQAEVRQFHPTCELLGYFGEGETVEIEVEPFRAALVGAFAAPAVGPHLDGGRYEIIRDVPDRPVELNLLGLPNEKSGYKLSPGAGKFRRAMLDGRDVTAELNGDGIAIKFSGTPYRRPFTRCLGTMLSTGLPKDAETLYEATCYAADSNALEVRSLYRSGETAIPEVAEARERFFKQRAFEERGGWDKFMFDGRPDTSFFPCARYGRPQAIEDGMLRVDFGQIEHPEEIRIDFIDEYSITPCHFEDGKIMEYSTDLHSWQQIRFPMSRNTVISLPAETPVRYLRFIEMNVRIKNLTARSGGQELDRSRWRGSNLFGDPRRMGFSCAWHLPVTLDEAAPGSYLCVAIDGPHGPENIYAALKMDGHYVGAPDRAPSYPANAWESTVAPAGSGYTYYIPVTAEMVNRRLEIYALGRKNPAETLELKVYLTCQLPPYVRRQLILER